jgi:hypothetical protein
MAGDIVVIGSHLEYTIVETLGAQTSLTILHTVVFGPIVGAPDTGGQATALDAAIATLVKNTMSNQATYRGVGCRLIDLPPTRRMFASIANLGFGNSLFGPAPPQTRGLTSWLTNFAGRGERGRSYWAFPSTGAVAPTGFPVAAYLTAVAALGAFWGSGPITLASGGNSAAQSPAIHNRKTGAMTVITGFITRPDFATQRRSGNLGRANPPPF